MRNFFGRVSAAASTRLAGFALRSRHDRRRCGLAPLLSCGAHAVRRGLEIAAKGVDVDAAAAQEARIDRQCPRCAASENVDEDSLDAAFVKCRMPPIGDQVAQQPATLDPRTSIADHHVTIVGLTGDRASRSEQRRAQRLLHVGAAGDEQRGRGLVNVGGDREVVQRFARQRSRVERAPWRREQPARAAPSARHST